MLTKSMLAAGLLAAVLGTATQARADEKIYELKKTDVKATVGAKSTTSLTIAARSGWHVNEEGPLHLKLLPDPGITVDKPKLDRPDLAQSTKDLARFDVAFTASEPGKKTINAEAVFVMCQSTTCKPVREKVAFAVDVAPAKKK
jgi:hypothetical protein